VAVFIGFNCQAIIAVGDFVLSIYGIRRRSEYPSRRYTTLRNARLQRTQ
jgi:hypothetical protein